MFELFISRTLSEAVEQSVSGISLQRDTPRTLHLPSFASKSCGRKKWGRDVYRIHFRVMAQREGMCIWHMWNIYDRFGSMRNQLFNKTFSGPASLACLARRGRGLERKSWKVFPKVYLKVINKWGVGGGVSEWIFFVTLMRSSTLSLSSSP